MKAEVWNRRILFLLLALLPLVALLLMISLRGFVREAILVPLSLIAWLGGIFIRSTPQAVFWGLVVLIGLILAIRSLIVSGKRSEDYREAETRSPRRQRVGFWLFQVYLAREGYSRVRFADFFSRLALEILAFREHVPPAETEERLQRGEIDASPEILDYLRIRRLTSRAETGSLLNWLAHWIEVWKENLARSRRGERAIPPQDELEKALRYLEDQLEVKQHHDV